MNKEWDEKFAKYHAENPEVFEKFMEMATKVKERGGKCSIYFLVERIRWFYMFEADRVDGFKFNNNFSPYYSRLINSQPGFENFFGIRDNQGRGRRSRHVGQVAKVELPDDPEMPYPDTL